MKKLLILSVLTIILSFNSCQMYAPVYINTNNLKTGINVSEVMSILNNPTANWQSNSSNGTMVSFYLNPSWHVICHFNRNGILTYWQDIRR